MRGERSTAVVRGEEGRQADREKGVWKDKAGGENVCRLQRLPASVATEEP